MEEKKDKWNDFNIVFGKYIKMAREKNNLTQRELAKKLGVCQSLIQYWENGKRNIDFYFAVRVCMVLKVDVRDFIDNYAYYAMM